MKDRDRIKIKIQQILMKELDPEEMSEEEINKKFGDFKTLTALYVNVRLGKMEIKSGRLKISDPNSCTFSLTPRGIQSVERMLRKK